MALNSNKSGFGFDMEERLRGKQIPTDTHTYPHTHTDTHEDADTDTEKETLSKRVYFLVKPSTHKKLKDYVKSHRDYDSMNGIINELLERFIEEKGL